MITPRILKGFRDSLPQICLHRERMLETLKRVFLSFGYSPIDTPAIEYSEILLGKGSEETDRQLYRFKDNGGRDVALRFDLTIPLARFAAMHVHELGVPFRRYHIAPVWRAEKPQRGRYREFIQCDFDVIGTTSSIADAESVTVAHTAFAALKVNHFIRVNNRGVLNGFLDSLGIQDQSVLVLRAIDKLDKLGEEKVRAELSQTAELGQKEITGIFSFLEISSLAKDAHSLLSELKNFLPENEQASSACQRLADVFSHLEAYGVPAANVGIDLSIARGLDYYTGIVFETECSDLPHIGSICGGGRYDNLASLYTKQELPGVGASIGLDRVLAALEELGQIEQRTSPAVFLVAVQTPEETPVAQRIAAVLRSADIATEIYPECKKLGAQFKYADRRGIPFVVFLSDNDLADNFCRMKHLESGTQVEQISLDKLAASASDWVQQF